MDCFVANAVRCCVFDGVYGEELLQPKSPVVARVEPAVHLRRAQRSRPTKIKIRRCVFPNGFVAG